jgi:hypothetical protein
MIAILRNVLCDEIEIVVDDERDYERAQQAIYDLICEAPVHLLLDIAYEATTMPERTPALDALAREIGGNVAAVYVDGARLYEALACAVLDVLAAETGYRRQEEDAGTV